MRKNVKGGSIFVNLLHLNRKHLTAKNILNKVDFNVDFNVNVFDVSITDIDFSVFCMLSLKVTYYLTAVSSSIPYPL